MIAVKVRNHSISVTGHAYYGKPGQDIVCTAVSALTNNLIYGFLSLTHDQVSYTLESGNTEIIYQNLSEGGKLLVDSFFIGICQIQEDYGSQYIQIQ